MGTIYTDEKPARIVISDQRCEATPASKYPLLDKGTQTLACRNKNKNKNIDKYSPDGGRKFPKNLELQQQQQQRWEGTRTNQFSSGSNVIIIINSNSNV